MKRFHYRNLPLYRLTIRKINVLVADRTTMVALRLRNFPNKGIVKMNIRSYIRYEIGDKINETARVIILKR